jgi:tRNA dimethylallyltransferase
MKYLEIILDTIYAIGLNPLIVVMGATATGKTKFSVNLAEKLKKMKKYKDIEILSADSRQVYKHLDIGTGKDLSEYGDIPYQLIDIWPPEKIGSVVEFQKLAGKILNEQRPFILCGGSGFYIKTDLFGYQFPGESSNHTFCQTLEKKYSRAHLQHFLSYFSPENYQHTDITSKRRIVRSIELSLHKRKQNKLVFKNPNYTKSYLPLIIHLSWPRSLIKRRIFSRLKGRIDEGMISETEKLIQRGELNYKRMYKLGLEYRWLAEYLQKRISDDEFIDSLYHGICRMAKRQESYFRNFDKNDDLKKWYEFFSKDLILKSKIKWNTINKTILAEKFFKLHRIQLENYFSSDVIINLDHETKFSHEFFHQLDDIFFKGLCNKL